MAIAKRTIPLEVIEPQVNARYEEKTHLEAEVKPLRLDQPPVKIISSEDFREYAQRLKESLSETETCRNVLKILVKEIRVQPNGDRILEYKMSAVCAIPNSATALRSLRQFQKPKRGGYRPRKK